MENPEVKNERFFLNSDCFLVKGAKRGAIYDLATGDVYSIDENSTTIVDLCEQGVLVNEVVSRLPQLKREELIAYLESLESLKVGRFLKENEHIEKIPLTPPESKLEFIWLELTHDCTQGCLHCYAESPKFIRKSPIPTLSLEQWKKITEDAYKLGARRIQFTGGEPMLFGKDIFVLSGLAKELGYELIEIFTNATEFDEEDIDFLAKHGVRVATNVYSSRAEIHDQITTRKGSFKKTIRNIKKLQDKGVKVIIATILMKQNEEDIEKTLEFLQELGEPFPMRRLDIVRLAGKAKSMGVFSEKTRRWSYKSAPVFPKITKEIFIKRKHSHSCWWGTIVVTSEGQVLPCVMARTKVCGNINEQPMADIIYGFQLQKLWSLSKDNIDICKNCEYRYACLDCRPLAEEISGSLCGAVGHCLYNPHQGEWRKITAGKGGDEK